MANKNENKFRQTLIYKAFYYAIKGDVDESEALRFYLRKIAKEDKSIQMNSQQTSHYSQAA